MYLFKRVRKEREQREREDSPWSRKPDMWLHPRTLGPEAEMKADA